MTHPTIFDLERLEFGEPSVHHTLTIIPVLGETKGPEYITLREAFDHKQIEVKERGGGARVPELEVKNKSGSAVLILDGEILLGAKQNRTLNTTVLLAPNSKTVVPVSCVESGRWHHTSPVLGDADAVLPHKVRHAKSSSVARALVQGLGYRSDQGKVWSEIEEKLGKHRVRSSSRSLGELYQQRQRDLEGYLDTLSQREGQRGLVAAIGGTIVGADILSRPAAYEQVHARLIKGYAAEDLERKGDKPPVLEADNAREFLAEFVNGTSTRHAGVGLGEEYRFQAERGHGAALVLEETVIHGVFLREQDDDREDPRRSDPPIHRRRRVVF